MKINWKLRLKNKTVLAGITSAVLAASYQIGGFLGYVPPISQDTLVQFIGLGLTILTSIGVVVDPTTNGISDSSQAMGYLEPKKED
nr:MAG TPA: holin [Caudoviricetes sp.]